LGMNETVNSVIDIIMAVQAVIMLRSLKTAKKVKWKLAIVFLIGGL
jgi:hypothetical protein